MIIYTFDGRLTRDAVVKTTKTNKTFTNFAVACDVWDATTKRMSTHYYECNYFGERGPKILPWLKKGKPVVISGEPSWNVYNEKTYERISVKELSLVSSVGTNDDAPDDYPVSSVDKEEGQYTDATGKTWPSEQAFNDALADEVWGKKNGTDDADIPF